ncbi:MAG: amidohydrolase family protein, partial [Spirochaetales bacterium]
MSSLLFKDIAVVGEDYAVREGMNLLVEEGRIAHIGPATPHGFSGEVYDGRGKVAMPGFFNTHSHVPMTLLRGYGEGLPLHEWLFDRMIPFEALLSDEDC